ncbi:hypothetical protein Taro_034277 [Colocasia esculenta]|uniref:Uncharacterized protein n=1 Tax=Colocasia esculenta TaxID=4460 RepID=A0A843W2G6_COLES|nr:hypothetical protein [Colocasia esculenta]
MNIPDTPTSTTTPWITFRRPINIQAKIHNWRNPADQLQLLRRKMGNKTIILEDLLFCRRRGNIEELTAHIGEDESEAPISLSKGNEVKEVDPHEIKWSSGRQTDIECESSDEEVEYTSDECEDDDEDGAELDISSSSEEEIWCVEDDRAPVLGGAAVGGVCWRHQLLVLRLSLLL